MRKVTVAVIALTFLVAGYVLAQVATAKEEPRTFHVFPLTPGQQQQDAAMKKGAVTQAEPMRISEELGLRIEGRHDGRVMGTLVAKVNGTWVDVHLASTNIRAVAPAVNR
ncbi:MAG: hypothetical protein QOJ98_2936 [Acidobacteriota bacterium]|jgi:hypothetical protein|nr:hypothetical protein [Acidobacteriota bacterium]